MLKFKGKEYLTQKEVAKVYGLATSWFMNHRRKGSGPPYLRLSKKGRVYYEVISVDKWFESNLEEIF